MTSIAELYAFQEIDLELNGCRAELEEINSQLGETEALAEAKTKVNAKKKLVSDAEATFREREAEADDLRAKIEPVERKLYEGSDLTAKELSDLQMDLESLRRRRSELEDHALEAMDTVEKAQNDVAAAEAELKEVEKQFGAEQSELVGRQVELRERIATLEAERAEEVATIDDETLALYEELAGAKHGRAIAKIEGGACGGCRISLPTNVLQRARSGGTQVRCSSCERILFVG